MSKTESGKTGEEIALRMLKKSGYRILEKNFRTKLGEIDIIATKDDCLIFVEVKARWSNRFGSPEDAITLRKLQTIARVGEIFRSFHKSLPEESRIDVVALEMGNNGVPTRAEIIENASG